jgi:CDGSH-type Zn-finger protein
MIMTSEKERTREIVYEKRNIKVCKDGPSNVSGAIPLFELTVANDTNDCPCDYHVGKRYPLQLEYSLCRCGQSKDKPFCDGTHEEVHFSGMENANREPYLSRAEKLDGPGLILNDVRDLCSHVGMCLRAGGIRELTLHSDDPEARHIAIEEVAHCNSGRLIAFDKKKENQLSQSLNPP